MGKDQVGRQPFLMWAAGQDSMMGASLRSFTHIWSPPDLQDSVLAITGTGLLSYIRPVGEEFWILWPR